MAFSLLLLRVAHLDARLRNPSQSDPLDDGDVLRDLLLTFKIADEKHPRGMTVGGDLE